jgi:phage gp29-like protein
LLNAGGSRAIDTDTVVKRYQGDIARTILADFIMLGQGDRGSFALSRSKVDLFAKALEGWLQSIAAVVNRHLVPSLWSLNGWDPTNTPYTVPGKVAPEDLKELGDFIEALSRTGIVISDPDTENRLRAAGGLPEAMPEEEDDATSTIPEDDDLPPVEDDDLEGEDE